MRAIDDYHFADLNITDPDLLEEFKGFYKFQEAVDKTILDETGINRVLQQSLKMNKVYWDEESENPERELKKFGYEKFDFYLTFFSTLFQKQKELDECLSAGIRDFLRLHTPQESHTMRSAKAKFYMAKPLFTFEDKEYVSINMPIRLLFKYKDWRNHPEKMKY